MRSENNLSVSKYHRESERCRKAEKLGAEQHRELACLVTQSYWTLGSQWVEDFPGKNTEVGCHFLIQRVFLTQGWDLSGEAIHKSGLTWWLRGKEPTCLMQETKVQSLGLEDSWRRKWQPSPVFLPAKSHGQRNLMVPWNLMIPWCLKESDTSEQMSTHPHSHSCEDRWIGNSSDFTADP